VRLGRPAVVRERLETSAGVEDVAGRIAEDRAAAGVANQVVAERCDRARAVGMAGAAGRPVSGDDGVRHRHGNRRAANPSPPP